MENAAYRQDYVDKFKREIEIILRLAESGKVLSYADVYREHERSGASLHVLRQKRVIIGAIERFDLYGQYPDGTTKLLPKGAYHSLCAEYKAVVDYHIQAETKRGRQKSSIQVQTNNASVFFLELQKLGVERLADVTEDDVFKVFFAPDGRLIRRCSCKDQTVTVLKTCVPAFPICERILAFLPALRNKRKNIQYLTPEEIAKIKQALSGEKPGLALRDKAIGILAFYMGLRGCDIAGLKMDSIDWEKDTLTIRQQKTGAPLTLPLSAIVGNAIYDYIETERPKTDCEYIFISQNRPFGRIQGGGTTCRISVKIMKVAGIRQEPGDRKGFHLFRHYLVTQLLGNGVPRPVISSVVGHTSPVSLDAYLHADFPHLKDCAISIECFPVNREVFAI
jgi:integrase